MTPSYVLSLGMMSILVKKHPAARDQRVSFSNVHGGCAAAGLDARLETTKSCKACGHEVPDAEIAKGYATGKGTFVVVSKAELDALDTASSKTMSIQTFVLLKDVDPLYFDKADYLGPADPAAAKGFALLREAMLRTGRAAVVQYVQSSREKIGLVRPIEPEGLILHELYYHTEVRAYAEQRWGGPLAVEVGKRELDLAVELVKASEEPLDLSSLADSYQQRITDLVQSRLAGQPAPKLEPAKAPAPVVDLMAALEQSLKQKKEAGKKPHGIAVGKLSVPKKPARKSA